MNRTKALKMILIVLFSAAIIVSCKKDTNLLASDATIINTGPVAVDGCGWLIKLTNDSVYNATNLDTVYQKQNLKVTIAYHLLTTKFHCGFVAGIPQIELKSIKKQ
jgi:hypothetical protein